MFKNIKIWDKENPDDDYYRKNYKDFTKSYATGNQNTITFYDSKVFNEEYAIDTIYHEIGHKIEEEEKIGSRRSYVNAQIRDYINTNIKHPTKYAENSLGEDFADSVMLYFNGNKTFKTTFKERSNVIDSYIKRRA